MHAVIQNLICTLALLTIYISCSPGYQPYSGNQAFKSTEGRPQYDNLDYWAAHPLKKDPSDSIPAPLRNEIKDSLADVFFIHPTTFTKSNNNKLTNALIDDNYINAKTDYTSILYQASVFNASARIYAPRYRQAFIGMYYDPDRNKAMRAFNNAYEDIKEAFTFYLEHYNQGRPIIIASHSQGTTHARRLMSDFFEGKPLMNQLVCAYLLGMPVEKNLFRNIPVCEDSSSTGCYMSWRTYREKYRDKNISPNDTTVTVVNPLSWRLTNETVKRENHKGAVLYDFNKVYKKIQDVSIAGNVLWISKPKFPGGAFYFRKNYHAGDINLFYMNIREDVSRRIQLFLKSKPDDAH